MPQDSFASACSVTGDGALKPILTGFAEKHGIRREQGQGVAKKGK